MSQIRDGVRNRLLLSLSDQDFLFLRSRLEPASYEVHDILISADVPISHVFFPETGQFSVVAKGAKDRAIEVGLIGREGMTQMVLVPGKDQIPLTCFAQVRGEGWKISGPDFAEALFERPGLLRLAIRYQQWMTIQACLVAVSLASYTIPQRLARWLLMVQDRADGDELPLLHQFLSMMLGVRRSGVTEAIHILEGEGAIRAVRAKILVRNRETLISLAAGSYGAAEAEYRRLVEER